MKRFNVFGSSNELTASLAAQHRIAIEDFPPLGNICEVVALNEKPKTDLDFKNYGPAVSFTWPETKGSHPTFGLQVFNNGVPVQLCVHGALATANYWCSAQSIESLVISMGDQKIRCVREAIHATNQCMMSATLKPHHLTPANLPSWIANFGLSDHVEKVYASPENNGYLLIEFHHSVQLETLPAFEVHSDEAEQRAVLYFKRLSNSQDKEQMINMRYFAPQYGNPEDAATGSGAAVLCSVLASFRRSLYSTLPIKQRFIMHQRSSQGGLIFTEKLGDQIKVVGLSQELV